MLKFFMPKQPIFFELLQQLDKCSKEIVALFQEFVTSSDGSDHYSQKAKEIEHWGDAKAHEIIDKLNRTFITPLDREDIYLLAQELDDIIDLIEDVIQNIVLYGIKEKKEILVDFSKLFVSASDDLSKMIRCLPKQKEGSYFEKLIIDIHGLEDRGDILFQKGLQQLFEKEPDPIAVIKWKDILEGLEEVMDKYQEVGDVIRGIIVKFS